MSLLTKEQQEVLRQSRQRHEQWRGDCDAHTSEVLALADIIDDLQARAPKQHTEQELYDKWFNLGEEAPCEYDTLEACARFLGALKADT